MLRPNNDEWRVLSGIGDPENFPVQAWVHVEDRTSVIVRTENNRTTVQISGNRMRKLDDEKCASVLSTFGVSNATEPEADSYGPTRLFEVIR